MSIASTDLITCEHCGTVVARVRQAQRYCSKHCRDVAAVARGRGSRQKSANNQSLASAYQEADVSASTPSRYTPDTAPGYNPRTSTRTAQRSAPSKAMTTRSNIMRTDTRSCPRVWTEGQASDFIRNLEI
jgi:hypothetical protein